MSLSKIIDDDSVKLFRAKNLPISLAALEEIIADEDSNESVYNRIYQHPEWPGGASGVTIALGYDLGYASRDKIAADFKGKVSDDMLAVMQSCAGITGGAAHSKMLVVRSQIVIPWNVALDVFLNRDIPQWLHTNDLKLGPNMALLTPTCRGVLLSLSYNRGASYDAGSQPGDRFAEMRGIKHDIATKNFAHVSAQLRSMARLWPVGNGVHSRRYREATLWDQGMKEAMPAPAPAPASPPLTS